MTGFELLRAMGLMDDGLVMELMSRVYPENKNYVNRKPALRMLIAAAVAASILAALGIAAYAIGSIHQRRQQELREQYKVVENNVTSYVEYPEPTAQSPGVSLLSAFNDGEFQYIYVNLSPISEEEVYEAARYHDFWCSVDGGTEFHNVKVPFDERLVKDGDRMEVYDEDTGYTFKSLSPEKWAEYSLLTSYDEESQTVTLLCSIINTKLEGIDTAELGIYRHIGFGNPEAEGIEQQKYFGSVTFSPTQAHSRRIMLPQPVAFGDMRFVERGNIAGIELHATAMKMLFDIEAAESLFAPGGDEEQLQAVKDWGNMMDEALCNTKLYFSDGTVISPGGHVSAPIENGYICAYSELGGSVDINSLEVIEIYGERFDLDPDTGLVKQASGKSPGVSLLSAFSDGDFQYGYVNIWPVSEDEARKGMDGFTYFCSVSQPGREELIDTVGIEYDPAELKPEDYEQRQLHGMDELVSFPSAEALERLRLKKSYDAATQTLTLSFSIYKKDWDTSKPLELSFFTLDEKQRRDKVYGSLSLDFTQTQSREIAFETALAFDNPELGQQGYVTGMTLYPCAADVYFDIPDADRLFGNDDPTQDEYRRTVTWLNPMVQTEWGITLRFADGTEFSLPSGKGSSYEQGRVVSDNHWTTSIDINSVTAIKAAGKEILFSYVN